MARFMIQFSYTAEAWQALVRNPVDRESAIRNLVEKLGGTFGSLDYCFGEWDGQVIFEARDPQSALATVLAAVTPGHLKATKTTRLFTMQELTASLQQASEVTYSGIQQQ